MLLPRWFKDFLKIFGIRLHRMYYFEQDLRKPVGFVESPIPINVKKTSKEDTDELLKLLNIGEKKRFEECLKENYICYIAKNEEKIAGYGWINTEDIFFNRSIGTIAKNGAYSFDNFVFPEFRGKKVFQKIITAYCEDLHNRGYEFVCNLTEVSNIPAVKARENLSTKKKLVFIILLPFGLRIILNGPIGQGKMIK